MITTRPTIPDTRITQRLTAARRLTAQAGLDAILVG